MLAAFASRADVSDSELTLLVSRSQGVARSVALRDAPLSESALLAVVNALDDVSPVLSRADLTPRVLAVMCERVDADGARRVARRGLVDGAVAAGLARNPWPSVRAIAAKLAVRARRFLFSPHVSLEALPFVFSSSCFKFDQN